MRDRILCWLCLLPILTAGCQPPDAPQETTPAAAAPDGLPQGPGTAVSADGVEIAYTVKGEGVPALVFIHCWMCDQGYWSEQVDAFAGDRAVVTLDLAGHGASGTGRAEWRLASFGPDVRAVVEALGLERVILVGHSMGGPAALEAARLMPGRVAGVIGVDTFHDTDNPDPEQWREILADFESDFAGTCDTFVRSMFPAEADGSLVDRTVADMCGGPPEIGTDLMREFGDYDLGAAMSSVAAPIRSVNSAAYTTDVEGNRQYAPGFDVALMEGVGHFLMLERPQELNRLLAEAVAALESRPAM